MAIKQKPSHAIRITPTAVKASNVIDGHLTECNERIPSIDDKDIYE